ncbi:MAG: hypothetical protein JW776_15350 [Candidatus Lokiarchaeota archaeon]|nr:hypothetical protein [Candidatus Lokiarchaeota archaeon]
MNEEASVSSDKKENVEIAELRQDTTKKQIMALETRIKYFQDQQSNFIPGKLLDSATSAIIGVVKLGNNLKKVIPKETREKLLDIYQKILLAF